MGRRRRFPLTLSDPGRAGSLFSTAAFYLSMVKQLRPPCVGSRTAPDSATVTRATAATGVDVAVDNPTDHRPDRVELLQ